MENTKNQIPTTQEVFNSLQVNDPTTAMLSLIWRQLLGFRFEQCKCKHDRSMLEMQEMYFDIMRTEATRLNRSELEEIIAQTQLKLHQQ